MIYEAERLAFDRALDSRSGPQVAIASPAVFTDLELLLERHAGGLDMSRRQVGVKTEV